MARRGRFNKNQKRDKNGRWTSGGSSSAKKSGQKSLQKRNSLTLRRSVGYGGVVGGLVSVGNPVAILAGSAIGGAFAAGRIRRRNKRER